MKSLSAATPVLPRGPRLLTAVFLWAGIFIPSRHISTLLLLLALAAVLASPARSQDSAGSDRRGYDYTFNVNVNMVVLHATAQNHKGDLVSGLGKNDFQVLENGVVQQIKFFTHEDIPVTVGLVIDNSGSMRPKRADVIAAALAFARSSNPQDQMFVINFNEKVSFGLPQNMPFTGQVDQLEAALSKINPDGETALYDAVAAALDHLNEGSRDKKVLIVISDGGDNASKHNLSQTMLVAGQSDALIYTIGIFDEQDGDRNPHMLRELAKNTGGESFLPESLKEVAPICERIAHDIRNQYTIAYVPTNRKRDGSYRVIQVNASAAYRGHLSVRTRTGYYAPSALSSPSANVIDHRSQN